MSDRDIIADSTMAERESVTRYQSGRHRPALWQDGESVFAVSKRAPSDGTWVPFSDQTYAKRAATVLWVRVPSAGDE